MAGSLVKVGIGKEDCVFEDDEAYPLSTWERQGSLGVLTGLTKLPNVWLTHQATINARYYNGGALTDVSIQAAIDNIGTDERTIYLEPGAWVISNDISVSANITLKIPPGSVLNDDASNASITILGNIEAGDHQIFDWGNGTGAISFGDNNKTIVNPYWWFGGTKNQDDEYAAFTSAIASMGDGCNFVVPAGEHYVSDTVGFNDIFRCTIFWYGRLAPYDTFDDYLVSFGIVTGAGADSEIAGLGNNFNVVGHIRLNCLNDSTPTLQQARGIDIYGVYMSKFCPITILGSYGTAVNINYVQENYFESIWAHGCKNRYAFAMPAAWDGGVTYVIGDVIYRNYADYAAGTTYSIDECVTYSSQGYRSLADSNVGNTPASGSVYWEPIQYEFYKGVRGSNLNKDPQDSKTTNQAVATNQYWQRIYRDEALVDMVQTRRYGSIDHQVIGHIDLRLNDNLTLLRLDHSPGYETAGGAWTEPSDPTGYTALTTILSGQLHAVNSGFDVAWGDDRGMTYPQTLGTFIELGRTRRTKFGNMHVRPGYQTYTAAFRLGGVNAALLCYAVTLDNVTITENGTGNIGISAMPNYYGETEPGRFDVTFVGMSGTSPVKYKDPNYKVFSAHGASQHLFYDQTGTIRAELGYTDSAWSFGSDRGSESLRVIPVTSAVNFLVAKGSIVNEEPSLATAGADTDIDLTLIPKGTAYVKFGTHTGLAAETLSGYITIKDAAGNTRKIGVVS